MRTMVDIGYANYETRLGGFSKTQKRRVSSPRDGFHAWRGNSAVSGEGSLGKTFGYLAAAAVFFAVASLIPSWVKRKYAPMTSE